MKPRHVAEFLMFAVILWWALPFVIIGWALLMADTHDSR